MRSLLLFVAAAVAAVAAVPLLRNNDAQHYRNEFQNRVVNPYKSGVEIFAVEVVQYLANAPIPSGEQEAYQVVQTLTQNVHRWNARLSESNSGAEHLKNQLDRQIEEIVARHSHTEQQLAQKESERAANEQQIWTNDQQLNEANNEVNNAHGALQNAQNQVNHAQALLDKGENCLVRGTPQKGFWGSIGDFFTQTIPDFFTQTIPNVVTDVINLPCLIVVDILGLRRIRDDAQKRYNERLQHLRNLQSRSQDLYNRRWALNEERDRILGNINNLNSMKRDLEEQRDRDVQVNLRIKAVVVHLSGLVGRTMVLQDAVNQLIDMETVIVPLNAIAEQMSAHNSADSHFFRNMQVLMSDSMPVIRSKMSQYPFITLHL